MWILLEIAAVGIIGAGGYVVLELMELGRDFMELGRHRSDDGWDGRETG